MKLNKVMAFIVVAFLVFGIYTGGNTKMESSMALQTSKIVKKIMVNFSEPAFKNESIEIKGCNAMLHAAGMPVLPEYRMVLKFPFGTRIKSIKCRVGDVEKIELDERLSTTPFPMAINNGSIIRYDVKQDVFPDSWISYRIGAGLDGENRTIFLPIHLYPARYVSDKNEIEFASSISVEIEYTVSYISESNMYDMIIITPSEFESEAGRLAEHKNEEGIKTKVVTLDYIYTHYYGDEPEKIKHFLKDEIERDGIKYALLVGDIQHLPSRKVYSFVWGSGMYSDYYYADIYDANASFCGWDSNGNGKYGEVGDNADKVDLYADLYVGRLACYDENELKTVVDKIINYENSKKPWFNRLILMGGDTFPKWNDIAEGEIVNEFVANARQDFEHIRIQTSLHNFLPWEINRIWNEGSGFICYSGHGFEYGFGTYPKNSKWMIAYYTPYLLMLKNEEKLPVVFFDACLTAKLDYHMFGNPHIPCFAWCLVKKANGGAIATIGATESATTSVTEDGPVGQAGYLDLHFFMAYRHGTTPSKMLVKAKHDYLNDIASGKADGDLYKMTLEQFILLGDPSLQLP